MCSNNTTEQWKPVVGYEGYYEVSSWGRVRRISGGVPGATAGRIATPTIGNHGYYVINLTVEGKRVQYLVHRLVAEAFIPRTNPHRIFVNHIDSCRTNNHVNNLEWSTPGENIRHSWETGSNTYYGTRHHMAKLNDDSVREIRRLYASGAIDQYCLAIIFDTDQSEISRIVNRKTWKHVS